MDKKTNPKPSDDGDLAIIYDAECPVCTAYSCSVEIDGGNAAGVRRINARSSDDALVQQAKAAGLDLDVTFVNMAEFHRWLMSKIRLRRAAPA